MTRRALLVGAASVVCISIATPYSDLVMRGTWIGLTALPISAVFLLAVLVLVNAPLRRLGRGLAGGELLTVFCMALVGAGIASFGLTGLLIPYLAGPLYFATPENQYGAGILRYLPSWLLAPGVQAARALYEGLPAGQHLPWAAWLVPLAAWSVLVGAVYLVFFCLCALLRRPWADDEKLVFPLVQLPIELTQYDGERASLPRLLRDPVLWVAFLVPFTIHTVNGLHRYLPALPSCNVHLVDLGRYLVGPMGEAVNPFWLRLLFSIVGLTYLLPSDLGFSLWFFYFFFLAQQVVGARLGLAMPSVQAYPVRTFVAHQMVGGILLFGVYLLWNARRHLGRAWRAAVWREADDKQEPIPFRLAVWGVGVGLAVIAAWGAAAGAGYLATLLLFLLFFVMQLVAVRLVAQAGMLYIQHPYRPLNLMLDALGTSGLGAARLPSLVLFDHLWMLDNRSPLMPEVLQGYKMAEAGRLSPRGLARAMALGVALAVPISIWSYLRLMYAHGGLVLNSWFTSYYSNNLYSTWTTSLTLRGQEAQPSAFITVGIGALSMLGLLQCYRSYNWWPFHPVGYLMGASWPMINFWFSVFLGWLIKSALLHYGGAHFYRRYIPAALGLIFGEFFAGGMWVMVDFLTQMRGHEIFSF